MVDDIRLWKGLAYIQQEIEPAMQTETTHNKELDVFHVLPRVSFHPIPSFP